MDWVTDKDFLKTAIELGLLQPGDEVRINGVKVTDVDSSARHWDGAELELIADNRAVLLKAPASQPHQLEIGKEYTWPVDKGYLEEILIGWRRP